MALANDALVVRGGLVTGEVLSLKSSEHKGVGVFGFSVYSYDNKTVEELVRAGDIDNKFIGVTRVQVIRDLGFDVVPTPGLPHHATLQIPRDAKPEDYARIADVFEKVLNPRRGGPK